MIISKIGYFGFSDTIPEDIDDRFDWVAKNTGNILFDSAIKEILDVTLITHGNIGKISSEDYDAFITTSFIWIQQNDADNGYYRKMLKAAKHKPLIPMCIGLQAPGYDVDFKINGETVNILSGMGERCVLGVRGNYTAEILDRHGIKNIQVIGCPSVFRNFDYGFRIENEGTPKRCCVNFNAFHSALKEHEKDFLLYSAERDFAFVEQNESRPSESMCGGDGSGYLKIRQWLARKTNVFFDTGKWIDYMRQFDFCMGHRFHGNVAALCAGVPALFVTSDSRTAELSEFFGFPTLKADMFDASKPLGYYAGLADYTEFNKNFPVLIDNFLSFCRCNNIALKRQP